ncbi:MAG: hypothetical protein QW076_03425 [Candidatus Anstonellales archaeon]
MDNLITCSELRLFEISRTLWLRTYVLNEVREFKKGKIMHKIIENDFEITESDKEFIDYKDIYKIKKIKDQIDSIGKLFKSTLVRDEKKLLKGKPDGLLNGKYPVEIKFYDYRKEDKIQALAYAYLLNTKMSFLVYPNKLLTLELNENHKVFLQKRINLIYKLKKTLIKGEKLNASTNN